MKAGRQNTQNLSGKPQHQRRTQLALPEDLYEQDLSDLYNLALTRQGIEQQTIAEKLRDLEKTTTGKDTAWKTWSVRLSRLRLGPKENRITTAPTPELLHTIAQAMRLSRYDEVRFLRAADHYPSAEELVAALSSARQYAEHLPWPALFVDYRLGILGWNSVLAARFALGQPMGPDLDLLPNRIADRPHLLYSLCAPDGFLHPVVETGIADDAIRLMVLVHAYWQPVRLWKSANNWIRQIEDQCQQYPRFVDLWPEANMEWARQRMGPYHALSNSPLHGAIQIPFGESRMRITATRLNADPRIELWEFFDMAEAAGQRSSRRRGS